MPGAGFKKTAKEWRATLMELAEKPMRFVKQEMAANHDPDRVPDRAHFELPANPRRPRTCAGLSAGQAASLPLKREG